MYRINKTDRGNKTVFDLVAHFFNSCVRSFTKFDTGHSEMTSPEEYDWVTKTGVKK